MANCAVSENDELLVEIARCPLIQLNLLSD